MYMTDGNDYAAWIDPEKLCNVLKLCSVRRDSVCVDYIAVRRRDGSVTEHKAREIVHLETFEQAPIRRIRCSCYEICKVFSKIIVKARIEKVVEAIQKTVQILVGRANLLIILILWYPK